MLDCPMHRPAAPTKSNSIMPAFFLSVMLAAFTAAADPGPEALRELLREGSRYFSQANEVAGKDPEQARELFRKAAMRFERIVREGRVQNGKLYYNIGNAYFRMEDLGRAILNYRRAEPYIPHDENLQQNLAYARARCRDRIPEPERKRVLKTLFFWHYDLTLRARSFVFLGGFLTFWTLAILRVVFPRHAFRYPLILSGLLALLMFGSVGIEAMREARERPGVIVAPETIARKGDSVTYEKSFTEPLHAGTEFLLIEDREDWLEVRLADGRTCWLPARDVELVRRRNAAAGERSG